MNTPTGLMLKRLSMLSLLPVAIILLLLVNPRLWRWAHPLLLAQAAAAHPRAAAPPTAATHSKRKKNPALADTTAPVVASVTFSGTKGTINWTETQSQPVQNGGSSFTATGANGSSDPAAPGNGVFKQAASPNNAYAGETQWYNGNYYVYNNQDGYLVMATQPSNTGGSILYGVNADQNTAFPLSGWFGNSNAFGTGFVPTGPLPAPTFTANAGTVVFDGTQGLAITGLSGGAVTITNVVTTGQATTFTMSRAPSGTETGGTFSGAASAFCDSASPVNMTAAFSIPITSGMFGSAPAPPRNLSVAIVY